MNRIGMAALSILLVSCDADDDIIALNTGSDTVFSMPVVLREIAALNAEDLTLEVTVNEQPVRIAKTGSNPDLWSGQVNVPAARLSSVTVSWSQIYTTSQQTYELTLAQQQKPIVVGTEDTTVSFNPGGYNTENHDQDDDGRSNLKEVEQNRSPVHRVDAFINETGAYPTGLPQPFSSECGTKLPIGVRVQYAGDPTVVDTAGDLSSWWCARFLETQTDDAGNTIPLEGIEITVDVDDDIFPITDSAVGRKYDDDSVEIFIDGNNSRGTNYDGQDDYQFVFLADGDNSLPQAKGPGSTAGPAGLVSSVELNATGYRLTVFIPRVAVGIQHGQPFGINVEVNDDDDGGLRDSKYTWIGQQDLDLSWTQPESFGTSQIP